MALAAIVAAAVGLTGEYTIGHGGLKSKKHPIGVGNAQLLVNSKPSTLATITPDSDEKSLTSRAPLFAEYATGTAIKQRIAQLAGVSYTGLTVYAATTQTIPGKSPLATAPAPKSPYYVTLSATNLSPVIRIATQAKTAAVAERLAAATATALRQGISQLAASEHYKPPKNQPNLIISKVVLQQLGAPYGATVITGGSIKKSVGYGVIAFVVLMILVVAIDNILLGRARRRRLQTAEVSQSQAEVTAPEVAQ